MTLREYKERLRTLSEEELRKFCTDFGGGQKDCAQLVRGFVDHPEHERRICQLLNLHTEEERITESALRSTRAAEQSATAAKGSMIWSGITCLIAFTALIVAAIGLLNGT